MEKFRKVWTDEINEWLKTTKGMFPLDAYNLFLKTYPDIKDVTYVAFKNQRSRMGASGKPTHNLSRKPRALWSEQVKKGYVRIKIAQPNVWVTKSRWVYQETHPWEECTDDSHYIFLNGDNRDFSPENIARLPKRCMTVFAMLGGCEKGNPEVTKLRIHLAKLKLAQLDAGEKVGLVTDAGGGRIFIEERNRKAREYNSTPERKKIIAERAKEYRKRLKTENPEKYAEMREKHKVYSKEYHKRKKESGCNG